MSDPIQLLPLLCSYDGCEARRLTTRSRLDEMSDRPNLFPTLGEVATKTDAQAEVEDDDVRLGAEGARQQEEGEDREVDEIESLCMRCHEQVSCLTRSAWRRADK